MFLIFVPLFVVLDFLAAKLYDYGLQFLNGLVDIGCFYLGSNGLLFVCLECLAGRCDCCIKACKLVSFVGWTVLVLFRGYNCS